VQFTYILNERNELELIYDAETDKPTVLNLTNHSYFNLNGCKETVLNEDLTVYADSITPVDSELIPTGAIAPVTGTPFDFTTPHRIGDRIDQVPGGYDINYVLRKSGPGMSLAAEVYDTLTGRLLQVYTTQPGVQVYTGNFLNGSILGYQGIRYVQHDGLCLETQHFPDSPNEPRFPSVVLHPGEKFHQATLYRFSIR
jgi:aldose 1-epimerase